MGIPYTATLKCKQITDFIPKQPKKKEERPILLNFEQAITYILRNRTYGKSSLSYSDIETELDVLDWKVGGACEWKRRIRHMRQEGKIKGINGVFWL